MFRNPVIFAYLLVYLVAVCGSPATVAHHPLARVSTLVFGIADWVRPSLAPSCAPPMCYHFRSPAPSRPWIGFLERTRDGVAGSVAKRKGSC